MFSLNYSPQTSQSPSLVQHMTTPKIVLNGTPGGEFNYMVSSMVVMPSSCKVSLFQHILCFQHYFNFARMMGRVAKRANNQCIDRNTEILAPFSNNTG